MPPRASVVFASVLLVIPVAAQGPRPCDDPNVSFGAGIRLDVRDRTQGIAVAAPDLVSARNVLLFEDGGSIKIQALQSLFCSPAQAASSRLATVGRDGVLASQRALIADLNRDGIPDAIMSSLRPNRISVFLGLANPAGATAPAVDIPAGTTPESMVLADLNGDSRLDLAVTNTEQGEEESGSISVLFGDGAGSFGPAVTYAAGLHPRSIVAEDFNGDGRKDLAVANYGGYAATGAPGGVSVLLANANGTFQTAAGYPANRNPVSLIALDFNGDGRLDLAVANYRTNDISFLPGNGAGGFGAAVHSPAGPAPAYLGAADLNRDGRWDLAVLLRESSAIALLNGNGNGTFQQPNYYLTGYSPHSFAFYQAGETAPPGIISPGLLPTGLLYFSGLGDGRLRATPAYLAGLEPSAIAAADFNRDGRLDVAVASAQSRTISIFTGDGAGALRLAGVQSTINESPAVLVAGDFNGDGTPDLGVGLSSTSSSRFVALNGRGDASFSVGESTGICTGPVQAAVFDYNQDSRPDVAIACGDGNLALITNLAGNRLSAERYALGPGVVYAASGDFNGDGRLDLAVAMNGSNPGFQILLANTNANTMRLGSFYTAGPYPTAVAAADFNADGKLDLAVSALEPQSHVETWLGNGDGTFRNSASRPALAAATSMHAADFDGDSKIDLVMAECCGETALAFLAGNGDGAFRDERLFPGGTDALGAVAGDFNGDRKLDLAVVASGGTSPQGTVAILLNNLGAAQANLLSLNAASNAAGGPVSPDSIVSAYGSGLAAATAGASSADWPTALGGSTVRVRDAAGTDRDARIAFVSAGQVNFVMPAATALGPATVTVTPSSGPASSGPVQVVAAAPGLFHVNGAAVGYALRVKESGEQIYENLVQQNSQGQIEPAPIDLGPETDQVVLLLFGTGVRGARASAVIGGIAVTPDYAGAQGEYPGFDQINLRLPRALLGRGLADIVVTADGRPSNAILIRVR